MKAERTALAAHLERPEVTDGRLARQWASVERRLPQPRADRASPMRVALWLSPIVAVCGWFAVIHTQHAMLPGSGSVLESSNTPLAIQLQDGSSLELAAQTRAQAVAHGEVLGLIQG